MMPHLIANPYLKVDVQDHIAVIWLDQQGNNNNSISAEMISAVLPALNQIDTDPNIRGAVIISSKKDFVSGIDMSELYNMQSDEATRLGNAGHDILDRIERNPKPIVAAINGNCSGAGLELVLACRSRLATGVKTTTFAAPEVRFGLLPAGGATYRLPKLIGLNPALSMLLTGRSVSAHEAWELGLVDLLCEPQELLEKAKEAVQKLMKNGKPKRRSNRPMLNKTIERFSLGRKYVYKKAYQQILQETQGKYPAPISILECVRIGLEKGPQAGRKAELAYLDSLLQSPEARQLMRIFSNMKEMKERTDLEKACPVDRVAILGGGLMGRGLSELALQTGLKVALVEPSTDNLQQAHEHIQNSLNKQVGKRMMSSDEMKEMLWQLEEFTDYKQIGQLKLVLEAIPENLRLKQHALDQMEVITPDDCIFASNTSSIPISEIAAKSIRPSQVIGMHFFAPVTKMPLLEIVITKETADWVVATAMELGHRMGKVCLKVKDSPGFYTTRLLSAYLNESLRLLQEGASILKTDKVMRKFGFSAGPFELIDEIGIDIAQKIISGRMAAFFAERGVDTSDALVSLVKNGYRGRKNKKGFYQYDPETNRRLTGKLDENIYSFFGGKQRRTVSSIMIQHRLSLTMINEAAKCLEEGIIESCRDGDMGAILGLGFPPFSGGPFQYMDNMGMSKIVNMLQELESDFGPRFKAAGIIKSRAKKKKLFYPAR